MAGAVAAVRAPVPLCRQPLDCRPGVCQRRGRTTSVTRRGRARGQERCGLSGTGEGPSWTSIPRRSNSRVGVASSIAASFSGRRRAILPHRPVGPRNPPKACTICTCERDVCPSGSKWRAGRISGPCAGSRGTRAHDFHRRHISGCSCDSGGGNCRPAGPATSAARERRAVSSPVRSGARADMDRPAGHDTRLPQWLLRAAHRPAVEELRENGWLDHVHPDDVDRCLATYMPAFEARRPFLLEYRLRHADGDYRWFLATGVPKYGLDGSFTGYVGCDIDITERKNAEDRIRESEAALESSHREIQYLAGRLIEAQDAERARIARDLHDDVSQQLAGVSIAFSGLKQRLGEYHVSAELQQELVALQQPDAHARSQRSSPLPRSPSDRAPAPGSGEGPHARTVANSSAHTGSR